MEVKQKKIVKVGPFAVGDGSYIPVQSMLSVPSYDVEGSILQTKALKEAGCDIVRLAIPDMEAVRLIPEIKNAVDIPLVADIHFDYRLALAAADAGVDKIRINPGNIGEDERVRQVVEKCREKHIPIRIGVNGGSLEKHILQKYGSPTPEALVASALHHVHLLERFDFTDILISLKSSDVATMMRAYELMDEACSYPLHLGVTEAGTERQGLIKSAVGIGSLLLHGIGDTIRVSLTADPVKEVQAGLDILRAIGLRSDRVKVVSCPTCGRTRIDLIGLASKVEEALQGVEKPITVAVMGCVVNGPGEAREADIGVAGGDGCGLLFKKGEILRKVPEEELLPALLEEVAKL